MSRRTRRAMAAHGLAEPHHRSHQLVDADVRDADLVVGFAPEHVAYVRRRHADAAPRTAILHHLVESLGAVDRSSMLTDRVKKLKLETVELVGADEVIDPAGGDEATFVACADEINGLIDRLAHLL